jgi:hypothetical protein
VACRSETSSGPQCDCRNFACLKIQFPNDGPVGDVEVGTHIPHRADLVKASLLANTIQACARNIRFSDDWYNLYCLRKKYERKEKEHIYGLVTNGWLRSFGSSTIVVTVNQLTPPVVCVSKYSDHKSFRDPSEKQK